MTKKLKKYFDSKLTIALFIGGFLGLFAAFASSVELTNGLKNPDYHALCSINPVISCGSVLDSKQGFIFGFSNSYLGMIGFSCKFSIIGESSGIGGSKITGPTSTTKSSGASFAINILILGAKKRPIIKRLVMARARSKV